MVLLVQTYTEQLIGNIMRHFVRIVSTLCALCPLCAHYVHFFQILYLLISIYIEHNLCMGSLFPTVYTKYSLVILSFYI